MRIGAMLQSIERSGDRCVVETLDGADEECPRYPLALAFGTSVRHCMPRADTGLDEELFGSVTRDTARLYAALVAMQTIDHLDDRSRTAPGARRGEWELAGDPLMTEGFIAAFSSHLLSEIDSGLVARGAARWGDSELGASRHGRHERLAEERFAALEWARSIIPAAWHAPFTTACIQREHRSATRTVSGPHCQSCSVSLLDPAHRGTSDRFCRFCADDRGRLKPRREVQRLISEWMRHWQGDLTEREAMQRAALYMQAMPAWSEN
jgi:hypothetical protein